MEHYEYVVTLDKTKRMIELILQTLTSDFFMNTFFLTLDRIFRNILTFLRVYSYSHCVEERFIFQKKSHASF